LTAEPDWGSAPTAMAKKIKKNRLAADVLLSLKEALRYARGENTSVVVHRVIPSASAARKARRILGIEPNPKAVRQGHKKGMAS